MKKILFLFLFTSAIVSASMAADFSEKEKAIIYSNAVKVLEDYQAIINQIGESVVIDVGKAKSGAESFLELFVNRQVWIFNDLDPEHKLSKFYEAETYSNNIILWYPDGLTINLDLANARVSDIITHDENVYSIDILARKSLNGNYLNQTINKNTEELTFRIAFNLENKALGKFRIVGIRSAESNFVDYTQALREVASEDFNPEDLLKIRSEIKTIIQDYTNFLSLIGDPQEPAEDKTFYKESFLKLFPQTDTRIYNDITPEAETRLIPVADYLANYIADYPNGIRNLSINSDSVKFGAVMKADTGGYYIYTNANKFFSGSYKGKDAFRNMSPIIFKVTFNAAENTFSDFRISGIDIAEVNLFEQTPGGAEVSKPEIVIRPVTRKGFTMSLIGSFGMTSIKNQNIESLTLPKDSVSWNVSPLSGFITAVGISYFLNDNLSFRSGFELNKYSARYSLSGNFTNTVLTADVNNVQYFRKVDAEYDSVVTINYITLPVLVNFTSGKPGKFGFYAEGGFKISIPHKATYKNTGFYSFYGYYPSYPAYAQIVKDSDAFGFYTRNNIDETGEARIKGFNLAFYSSLGINIPLGYYSSVTFGPEMIIGITDILGDNGTYYDIFGKSYTHQPTKIKNFGFRVSLAYKL